MSDSLNEFLIEKREAIERRTHEQADRGPNVLQAWVCAEGRSGVRGIRIRDFQVSGDSGRDFAGYNLGPSSPELQLGVLARCLTHVFLIQAASRGVPLDSLEVEVSGQLNPRAGTSRFEDVPIYPHNITYRVHLVSSASEQDIAELHQAVERTCPIYNHLLNPQHIIGTVEHTTPKLANQ